MTFSYYASIPAAGDPPKNDQPLMQVNTNSIQSLIQVDHEPFNDTRVPPFGGFHKVIHQTQFSNVTSNPPKNVPTDNPNPVPNVGELFTAQINRGILDEVLFYQSSSGRVTQLTNSIADPGFQAMNAANGYTSIPGGLIIQWGSLSVSPSGTATPVSFPLIFLNNVWSVVLGFGNNSGNSPGGSTAFIKDGSLTTSGFKITSSSSGSIDLVYWIAIGT